MIKDSFISIYPLYKPLVQKNAKKTWFENHFSFNTDLEPVLVIRVTQYASPLQKKSFQLKFYIPIGWDEDWFVIFMEDHLEVCLPISRLRWGLSKFIT